MNGEKMKVVIGSWLALALISGSNLNAADKPVDHGTAGTKPAEAGTARPKALSVPLPEEYEQLKAALEKVDSRGLTVKESVNLAGEKKDVTVAIGDVVKLRNWLDGNFKKYREFLTSCAVAGDKSSDITGKLLDGFIKNLAEAITDDPKNAAGLKEKHLITFVTQMERVLAEKAKLFSSTKGEFEKADEKLLDQMKKSVGFLFAGYHGEQFDNLKQSTDEWAKPFVADSTAAIEALVAREGASGKVCKLGEEKPAETTAEVKPTEPAKPTTAVADANKDKPKLDPGPIEGGNADDTKGGDNTKVDPGTVVGGGDTTIPTVDDGNIPFIEPGNNQAVNDFDADALLKGVLDRFGQLEEQAKLDQDRAKQDLQNAVDSARRLGDDIARQQQQAIDANNNNDNGLADALGKLATNQQQPPPPPPAPPAPPPTIIPPQDNGQQAQQQPFPPPQQDDFGGQQQPPPQQPFFPPPQQSTAPIIIGGDDSASKYLQDDYNRRNVVQPVANPQQGGMLELLRLQQQLMFAQQQAQYGGQAGQNGGRLNVNTMANRLSGGAGIGSSTVRRAIPGTTGAVATQAAGTAGRSTTVPAAIRGAK